MSDLMTGLAVLSAAILFGLVWARSEILYERKQEKLLREEWAKLRGFKKEQESDCE